MMTPKRFLSFNPAYDAEPHWSGGECSPFHVFLALHADHAGHIGPVECATKLNQSCFGKWLNVSQTLPKIGKGAPII